MDHAVTESRIFASAPTGLRPMRLLVVICLIVACALLCVRTRHQVAETGYALEENRRVLKDARTRHQQLSLSLSGLKSPDHLERRAKQMGLNEMSAEQVRRVRAEDVAR